MPDISPEIFPLAGLLVFFIPLLLLLNVLFLVFWLFQKQFLWACVAILVFFSGLKFIPRLFPTHIGIHKNVRAPSPDFKVLSCNVRIFNVYEHLRDHDFKSSIKMMEWLRDNDADILCLQEFYNSISPIFESQKKISVKYPFSYVEPFLIYEKQIFGMAIFSRFPILNFGSVKFREKSNNQIIYIDIKIKQDTIRVYNIHLQSISIDEEELINTTLSLQSGNKWLRAVIRYKKGCIQRASQVNTLVKHILACPYPCVVCGDINEPPFGYVYEQLSETLLNAFQLTGTGIGSTYNGKIPFLRIDNIFAHELLTPVHFKIHKEILYSDHFPISCTYKIKR
jgi:endonuclease/exonuclease/phosphatase family metal-dependent hydrolase